MEDLVKVSGEFGAKPSLEFLSPDAPAGLQVVKLVEGDGAVIEKGDQIAANYLGQVWDGAHFDNSFDRGQPLVFVIGVGMVIKGWDQALVGTREGDRLLISIPAELGYGERGVPQAGIPGGATLVFVTDVVKKL